MRGVIANIITYAKLFVNRFRGFGVLTHRNFVISIRFAGQSYNSVSTAMLHCDLNLYSYTKFQIKNICNADDNHYDKRLCYGRVTARRACQ